MVTITTTLELLPFDVPTEIRVKTALARRQEGLQKGIALQFDEVDMATIDTLCAEFREAIIQRRNRLRDLKILADDPTY